jgi:CRP/FNR family transcriptional regulator, cyclic AMP receptor protein
VSGDVRHSGVSQAGCIDLAEAIARDGLGDSQVDDVAAVQHLLRQVPLFKRIGKRHLRLLAGRCHVIRYRPGEPIVRAGFSGEGFFTIAGGRARVERPDGHTVILAEGDCFGDLSLIDGASRNATVVAETDLIALKLTRQTFLDLLDAEPTVCRALVDSLVDRIRAIEARLPA